MLWHLSLFPPPFCGVLCMRGWGRGVLHHILSVWKIHIKNEKKKMVERAQTILQTKDHKLQLSRILREPDVSYLTTVLILKMFYENVHHMSVY
jgi:hypothetical protein